MEPWNVEESKVTNTREFVLIGKFDDQITSHLESINKTLGGLKRTLNGFAVRSGGFDDLTKSIGKVVSAHKVLNKEVVDLRSEFSKSITVIREYKSALASAGQISTRNTRANIAAINAETAAWGRLGRSVESYQRRASTTTRGGRSPLGGGRPPSGGNNGGGPGGGGRNITGDIISGNLISNAIISGFQVGVGILQQGMNTAFNALAERSKDQMEDIASSGGIYAAFKYNKIPGGPKSFQDAMDLQDNINKEMAVIAANLPGTTHDYVENSRRLVDTTGQIMAKDFKGFTDLAKQLTGNLNINSKDAFTAVNVDIAKSTTMLEKLNPSRSVVPMTQLVEDMMKDDKVTVGGLRKYVAFKRSTTFQAALDRHLEELNAAGASTAKRLAVISKILKEAVPAPMVNAFMISAGGITEGFRSAFLDPDMGIFGLSRRLTQTVIKYNRETGEKMGTEITNFYKVFSETFGNLGNLINNSILPGLAAVYSPFEGIANSLKNLREYSYRIFKAQQEYTQYFQNLADKYGMSAANFQVSQKGGLTVIMDIMRSINALSANKYSRYQTMMQAPGSAQEISDRMTAIYKDIIPEFFNSPIMKTIGKEIAKALAQVFKEIANLLRALMGEQTGASEFLTAFNAAGGMKAINDILVLLAEAIGKMIMELAKLYIGAFGNAISSGNFAAAAVLGAPLALGAGPLLGLLGRGGVAAGEGAAAGAAGAARGGIGGLFASRGTTAAAEGIRGGVGAVGRGVSGAVAPYGRAASTIGAFAAGSKVVKAARFIPGASLAIGAVDAGLRMAGGQNAGEAVGHAAAGVIGSTLGSILGQALIPVPGLGAVIGGIAGGLIGDHVATMIGDKFNPASSAMKEAAEAQRKAAAAQDKAASEAQKKYGEAGTNLGGIEAISRRYGGGIGYKKALQTQYVSGKISTVEYLKQSELADKMTTLNLSTEKVTEAQRAYDEAVRLGVGNQTELARKLKVAQEEQAKSISSTTTAWQSINATNQREILTAAGAISISMKNAAAIIAGGAGSPGANINSQLDLINRTPLQNYLNSTAPGVPAKKAGFFDANPSSPFNVPLPPKPKSAFSQFDGTYRHSGSLSSAIDSEMANKPSGSKLVIANSSETVIPAAGGLGMGGLVDAIFSAAQNTASAMSQGFGSLQQTTAAVAQNTASTLTQGFGSLTQITAAGDQSIVSTQRQTASDTQAAIIQSSQAQLAGQQQLMAAIQSSSMGGFGGLGGMGGGAGGAGYGGAGVAMAGQLGNYIKATGGAPGSIWEHPMHGGVKGKHANDSLHYAGRAIDIGAYANEQGPVLARIAAFNAKMGWKPVELLHAGNDPNHQDHVHVAYALGEGNPAFFNSREKAQAWEKSMVPSSVKVGSITSNSAEGFGGQYSISNNITIHQQPGQDADHLAAIVVQKMGEWVSDARASSIFV